MSQPIHPTPPLQALAPAPTTKPLLLLLQIADKQDEAAMAYGRTVLCPACSNEEERELLEDALSLFAYKGGRAGGWAALQAGSYRD